MNITSKVKESPFPKTPIKYPFVGYDIHNPDLKVLFFEDECGVVLDEDSNLYWYIGAFNDDWNMKDFAPFYGEITIKTEEK